MHEMHSIICGMYEVHLFSVIPTLHAPKDELDGTG